jgi:hypothetical protein
VADEQNQSQNGTDLVARLRHMAWTALAEQVALADRLAFVLEGAEDEIKALGQKIGNLRAEAEQDDETIRRLRALLAEEVALADRLAFVLEGAEDDAVGALDEWQQRRDD